MKLIDKSGRKREVRLTKIISVFLSSLLAMLLLLFMLRAVFAFSAFHNVTQNMQASGWLSSGNDSLMQVKEELTYEASYLLFKIGSVRLQVLSRTEYDNLPAYRLRAYIDSYSGIPFVDLHAVYETYADSRTFMCLFTSNSQKEGDGWIYTSYHFDLNGKVVKWEQSRDGKIIKTVSYPLDHSYTDGVSFFYYLRESSRIAGNRRTDISIPIAIDTIRSSIDLTINEAREPCDVTAFDFPVDSYRLSGHMNFKGFYGVTGDFVGWMSTDSSEVPLKANVKVVLGSVVVKLKDVRRDGWTPSRGND